VVGACRAAGLVALGLAGGLLASSPVSPEPKRPITARDLIELRDIGYPDAQLMGGLSPLAVSPDGRQLAFILSRADIGTNGYCRALVVMQVRPGAVPRVVDRGGELITITDVQRGMFVRGGFPALVRPAWSPDGVWIAYLKRIGGSTQAWRVRADGRGAKQVTHLPSGVESVAWSSSGRLLIGTRPAKAQIEKAIEREGQSGWLYDDRVVTFSGARPQIREKDAPLVTFEVDPETGAVSRAAPREDAGSTDAAALTAAVQAVGPAARRAWVERKGLASSSDSELKAQDGGGRTIVCGSAVCHGGIIGLWWSPDGRELHYLRRQGWNMGEMAFYRWRPGQRKPRPVLTTRDAIIGCVPVAWQLVCTRENATTPRRITIIDPANGRSQLLFDPNPGFAQIELGTVERLTWRNDRGLQAWGDLVLPPGYRPGQKLPLVVVQYSSRGFLRGGTGDEYPIYLLAAHGFAVLSFERPPFVASLYPSIKDWISFAAANMRDWAERRSILSAVQTGVRMVIDRGIADPARIGITGLSDGATTARFALINSDMFSAASISTCCLEPWTVNTYAGIAFAEFSQKVGYPSLIRPDPDFWRPMSVAENASRMNTPLLMQLDDDDGFLLALEAFESLREYGKPVEMYVFPHEYHVKWQPVHRLAIYERNVDWFDFWLRGVEDPDPAKAEQFARWRHLRELARRGQQRGCAAAVR
jgi:dipeptidyl aminopeptidase/acylaminoacyl peptidase